MTAPTSDASDAPSPPPRSRPPSFLRRHWGKLTVAILVIGPALVFALWATIALAFSYSEGTHTGYNQKLARRGWLCKTWEGELTSAGTPGQAPERFAYSVRDDAVAAQIQRLEGRLVALRYEEHPGVPSSCFGETEYFATGVRAVDGDTTPVSDSLNTPQIPSSGAARADVPGATAAP